jgi:hypothetical protein
VARGRDVVSLPRFAMPEKKLSTYSELKLQSFSRKGRPRSRRARR